MTRHYTEVPPEAPMPKIWKSLGILLPGLEVQYDMASFNDDLDIDRESDLKAELAAVADVLGRADGILDGQVLQREKPIWTPRNFDGIMARQRRLLIRFVIHEPHTLYVTHN